MLAWDFSTLGEDRRALPALSKVITGADPFSFPPISTIRLLLSFACDPDLDPAVNKFRNSVSLVVLGPTAKDLCGVYAKSAALSKCSTLKVTQDIVL